MESLWLRLIGSDFSVQHHVLAQARSFTKTLNGAISNRDWSLIQRVDRLSGDLMNTYVPKQSPIDELIVAELIKLKHLYRNSISLLQNEIKELSKQAI